jgi:hypothetical protein
MTHLFVAIILCVAFHQSFCERPCRFNMLCEHFVSTFNAKDLEEPNTVDMYDLDVNVEYAVIDFKKVWRRHGFILLAILRSNNEIFQSYLPSKYTNRFSICDLRIVRRVQFYLTRLQRNEGEEAQLYIRAGTSVDCL